MGKTMAGNLNQEYHDYINHLSEQEFCGQITLDFQRGVISNNSLKEWNTKSEIKEKLLKGKAGQQRKIKDRTWQNGKSRSAR
jgi:hypothetical protein